MAAGKKKSSKATRPSGGPGARKKPSPADDPSGLATLPVTYQAISDYFAALGDATPFALRKETFRRIEQATERPLLCYVMKTNNLPPGIPAYMDENDLTGFDDLCHSVEGKSVDVLVVSNGGSVEATERIVRLLRDKFESLRFILPANAYSAATLMCFAADEVLMSGISTLGPIDPQINGVPARAILRAFETIENRLKEEGPRALTAYMPLISKYDLHVLEICKSAEDLSRELARDWLSTYMLTGAKNEKIERIVEFFSDYDMHKSHGRSIGKRKARELGLRVRDLDKMSDLNELVRSLYNQYELWFDKTPFYKVFENAHGISWGRQLREMTIQLPHAGVPGIGAPAPQPGPVERSG